MERGEPRSSVCGYAVGLTAFEGYRLLQEVSEGAEAVGEIGRLKERLAKMFPYGRLLAPRDYFEAVVQGLGQRVVVPLQRHLQGSPSSQANSTDPNETAIEQDTDDIFFPPRLRVGRAGQRGLR